MDPEFWHNRWRTREIGFHQSSPHPCLERWWPTLGLPPGARVYVPLCGKSLDMVWLAVRGHEVVGTELSALAIEEFFGERRAGVEVRVHGPFRRHAAGPFAILEGDALELTSEWLGPVRAAYDRAALIALPAELRTKYARQFAGLLPPGAKAMLVVLEFDQRLKPGPAFSIEPDEVRRLYGDAFTVREVARVDIIDESPKYAATGLRSLVEVAYLLERR